MDPRLAPLRALLEKSPFDTFKSFRLLAAQTLHCPEAKVTSAPLPNGKALRLTYLGRLREKGRALLRLKVDYPGMAMTYKVGEGDAIPLVVGAHAGGALVLTIDCVVK